MNKEKLEIWRRKVIELEEKVKELNNHRFILINIFNELNKKTNIKFDNLLFGIELQEEIAHLNDWIEFYSENIEKYETKLRKLEQSINEEALEKRIREITIPQRIKEEEKEEKPKIAVKKEEKEIIKVIEPKEKVILEKGTADLFKFISKEVKPEKEEIGIIKEEKERKQEIGIKKKIESIEVKELQEKRKEIEKHEIKVEERLPVKEELKEPAKIKELPGEEEKKLKIEIKKELKKQIKEFKKKETRKPVKFKGRIEITKKPIQDIFKNLYKNKLIRYGIPIMSLLLIISILFISKPEITGYVVLTQEKTYDDSLGLIMNESGNYTWTADKLGYIKSIKASGKVKGNGTVKIYIEKDGKRYLIFDNKKANDSGVTG